jgi:hypothetical protein
VEAEDEAQLEEDSSIESDSKLTFEKHAEE